MHRQSAGRLFDFAIFASLILLGLLQWAMVRRAADFIQDDVSHYEIARSIIDHHFYGFNSTPERNEPPVFPLLLAFLYQAGISSYVSLLRLMPLFCTAGLIVAYELIRRLQGRRIAFLATVLPATSSILFRLTTQWLLTDIPYFFVSAATLLLALCLDESEPGKRRTYLIGFFTLFLCTSLLTRSAALAFLIGIVSWIVASHLMRSPKASLRQKLFVLPVMVAALVQSGWMHQKPLTPDWPLPGYPQSYLSQLSLKSGNQPELGKATVEDYSSRLRANLEQRTGLLIAFLTRLSATRAFYSPLLATSVLLILLGWGTSVLKCGGNLVDWYFIAYEAMYLLWPWDLEARFFLPVAPLAAMYLFSGARELSRFFRTASRAVARWLLVVSLPLCVISIYAILWRKSSDAGPYLVFWTAVSATAMVIMLDSVSPSLGRLFGELAISQSKPKFVVALRTAGTLVIVFLLVVGIYGQVGVGLQNLRYSSERDNPPDVVAGIWIAAHSPKHSIIMAAHVPIVFHYSQRRVIWFPPISDPQVLMDGIQKHGIEYVVVVIRSYSYYRPSEMECFEKLQQAYPDRFKLAGHGPHFQIYQRIG